MPNDLDRLRARRIREGLDRAATPPLGWLAGAIVAAGLWIWVRALRMRGR